MTKTTCPTCGASVAVVGSDEGTMHFRPAGEARIRAEERRNAVQEVVEWLQGERFDPEFVAEFVREFGATTDAE